MKVCTKCGESKPLADFSNQASSRDGHFPWCRQCKKAQDAQYRLANLEKVRAYDAKRYAEDPKKHNAQSKRWREANPERAKALHAAYHVANREKIIATVKKWIAENRERAYAIRAKWDAANPDCRRIRTQNRRARLREAGGTLSKGLSDRLFSLQRGLCACGCKQPLGDKYHLDHIMPLALGGTNTDDNIQLLCAPCNLEKHAKHPVEFMQQRGYLL